MSEKLKYPGSPGLLVSDFSLFSRVVCTQFPEIQKFSTLAELAPTHTSAVLPARPVNQFYHKLSLPYPMYLDKRHFRFQFLENFILPAEHH